jgi:hypothetical protein
MKALEVERERLESFGASRLRRYEPDSFGKGHIVMLDPEGNEFCLD